MSIGQIIAYISAPAFIIGTTIAIAKYVVGGWVKDFRKAITEPIARIETQLCNHNAHSFANLEEQGKRTNELLEKIHDGQIEMSGFLKGLAERK